MSARVALVAIDSRWRDPKGTFYSFSYGIEKLRASIRSAPDLDDVEVLLLDLPSGDPEACFEQLRAFSPTLVGLSAYIWSLGIFDRLTERLRDFDPTIALVMGGPAARRSVLDLAPHRGLRDRLDAIIPGEGEQTIRDLVRDHQAAGWQRRVPGLMVPRRGLWSSTGPSDRPELDQFPSPYQLGLGPREKTGYIETFRGCPIHCAFCQWGDQKSDRVHSAAYLAEHLRGLAASRAVNVFFLDAAFNLSPRGFRALEEAEAEARVLKDMVVHGHLYPTHLEERHLAFFERCGQVQASVGIQSFDEEVLRRLGRPFDIERFQRVLRAMRGRLDVDIELIFGLPGDGPESFKRTFETALALGASVKVFRCLVLPDALLERSDELSIEFDPVTFELLSAQGWTSSALERTWAWVQEFARAQPEPILNDDWVGFVIDPPDSRPARPQGTPRAETAALDAATIHALGERLHGLTTGYTLLSGERSEQRMSFALAGPVGEVRLEVELARTGPFFVLRDGLGYKYRGQVDRHGAGLRVVIDALHEVARTLVGPTTAEARA